MQFYKLTVPWNTAPVDEDPCYGSEGEYYFESAAPPTPRRMRTFLTSIGATNALTSLALLNNAMYDKIAASLEHLDPTTKEQRYAQLWLDADLIIGEGRRGSFFFDLDRVSTPVKITLQRVEIYSLEVVCAKADHK